MTALLGWAGAAPLARPRPDDGRGAARLLPAVGGAARGAALRGDELRRHGRRAGDDRRRLRDRSARRPTPRCWSGCASRFDAVMIGAGTMRAERYGRPVADQAKRERRERLGLPHDPLMVIVSGRLDLPWDAPLFTEGAGGCSSSPPRRPSRPRSRPSLRVVRHEGGAVDLAAALRHLRRERGVRALLCEGGPRLHGAAPGGGPGRRALPDDRPEAGRRRGAPHRRGRAAGDRPARAGLAAGGGRRAVRPLQAALSGAWPPPRATSER